MSVPSQQFTDITENATLFYMIGLTVVREMQDFMTNLTSQNLPTRMSNLADDTQTLVDAWNHHDVASKSSRLIDSAMSVPPNINRLVNRTHVTLGVYDTLGRKASEYIDVVGVAIFVLLLLYAVLQLASMVLLYRIHRALVRAKR